MGKTAHVVDLQALLLALLALARCGTVRTVSVGRRGLEAAPRRARLDLRAWQWVTARGRRVIGTVGERSRGGRSRLCQRCVGLGTATTRASTSARGRLVCHAVRCVMTLS